MSFRISTFSLKRIIKEADSFRVIDLQSFNLNSVRLRLRLGASECKTPEVGPQVVEAPSRFLEKFLGRIAFGCRGKYL